MLHRPQHWPSSENPAVSQLWCRPLWSGRLPVGKQGLYSSPKHWALFPVANVGSGGSSVVERRIRDRKASGSGPGWTRERIFFSRVFCADSFFRYPFHPRVTAVARKRSCSLGQKCRWRHDETYALWFTLSQFGFHIWYRHILTTVWHGKSII